MMIYNKSLSPMNPNVVASLLFLRKHNCKCFKNVDRSLGSIIHCITLLPVLSTEFSAMCMLGVCSTTEINSQLKEVYLTSLEN